MSELSVRLPVILSHRISAHLDTVGVVNQSVEDTVSGGGIADLLSPGWQADRPFRGRLFAIVLSSATLLVEIIPGSSRTRFRDRPETVRLHRGIGVHFKPESAGERFSEAF